MNLEKYTQKSQEAIVQGEQIANDLNHQSIELEHLSLSPIRQKEGIVSIISSRTNSEWVGDLRTSGQVQKNALTDLRAVVARGLPYALSSYVPRDEKQFPTLIDKVIQETLLWVLDELDAFEGQSQFTTWVYKIAVRLALTELRCQKWRDTSLEGLLETNEDDIPVAIRVDSKDDLERLTERNDTVNKLRKFIDEELTVRQRNALMANAVVGLPMDIVADRMQMDRNTLYKLMHDARLKLKQRLIHEGMLVADTLVVFEDE